jgi:peptidoglycan/LPS O-acetylase OafA/YrhL
MAAMAVLVFHFGFQGGVHHVDLDAYDPAIGGAAKYGYLGVDIFFMISGLVIAWSASGSTAWAFAWKRFLRIYPTFVLAAAIAALVIHFSNDPRLTVTLPQFIAHLAVDARRFGQRFLDGSYWTIVFELFFYGMVAVGLAVPALRRRSYVLLWLWLAIGLVNEFVLKSRFLSYFAIADYCGLFIVGVMIFRITRGRANIPNVLLLLAAFLYALERGLVSASGRFATEGVAWSPTVVASVLVLGVAILFLATQIGLSKRLSGWLQHLGSLTYPLYLLHGTIGYIFINRLIPHVGLVWAILLVVPMLLALSSLIAELVEPRIKTLFERGFFALIGLLNNAFVKVRRGSSPS